MGSTPEATVAAYFDALNRSDAEALTSLFDEDGVFIGQGAPTASGRPQIRALAEGAFGAMRVDHEYEVDRIEQRDGLAVVQTHSHGTLTMLEPGTTVENAHRELYALRDDGERWLITHYMYNSASGGAGAQ
jgi:uncharacterized protein (TIGR02246 family)